MIFTATKLVELIGQGTAHIRKPHWPAGLSAKFVGGCLLYSAGPDKEDFIIEMKGLWEIDWSKPASVPLMKRIHGGSPFVLMEDGSVHQYRRKSSDVEWETVDGNTYSTTAIWYSEELKAQREAEEKKKQRYLNWLLSSGSADGFTFGFELETHESDGMESGNWRNGLSRNAPKRIDKFLKEKKTSKLLERISNTSDPTINVLKNLAASKLSHIEPDITPDVEQHIKKVLIDSGDLPMEYAFPFSENIVVGTDNSVKGFEFKTSGGKTATEFDELVSEVFSISHSIRTDCSFHVHVGSPRIELPKSRNLQQLMINKVIADPRVPSSVRERWTTERGLHFCNPHNDGNNEKYSFIRIHKNFSTLEFRCFGNVKTVEDGRVCREIALDAVMAALQANPAETPEMPPEWKQQVSKALAEGKCIDLRDMINYAKKLAEIEAQFEAQKNELRASYEAL